MPLTPSLRGKDPLGISCSFYGCKNCRTMVVVSSGQREPHGWTKTKTGSGLLCQRCSKAQKKVEEAHGG